MDDTTKVTEPGRSPRWRRSLISLALVGTGVLAGGVLAGTQIAGAATASSTSSSSATAPAARPPGMMDPSAMTHGPGEKLLTGSTADQVTAAAEAAVPNATIVRVETDADGGYEAHMRKADGSYVTVKVDRSFAVTSTEEGFGPGPQGCAPMAPPPSSGATTGN